MEKYQNFVHQDLMIPKGQVAVLLLCLDWSVLCEDVGFGHRSALLNVFIMKCVCFGADSCL